MFKKCQQGQGRQQDKADLSRIGEGGGGPFHSASGGKSKGSHRDGEKTAYYGLPEMASRMRQLFRQEFPLMRCTPRKRFSFADSHDRVLTMACYDHGRPASALYGAERRAWGQHRRSPNCRWRNGKAVGVGGAGYGEHAGLACAVWHGHVTPAMRQVFAFGKANAP